MKSANWRTGFDIAQKQKELRRLRQETEKPDFWQFPQKAAETNKQISGIEEEIKVFQEIGQEIKDIEDFISILKQDDEELIQEIKTRIGLVKRKVKGLSSRTYFSGKYDKNDAVLELFAGAGGRDAQDWAAMLQRMYERYCQQKGLGVRVLDSSFGEAGGPEGRIGIKNATIEIKGTNAFGLLKNEAGVHRLVRISPFSPQKLRHTSFAQVTVLPKIKDLSDVNVKIENKDLKIETFRSSGPGGQYMQKTESAVRITHLPTKITATCQSERLQAQNKKKAMEILYVRLYRLERQRQENRLKSLKGVIDPAWGKQIRSYVLHPYKMVKDLRTNVETSDVGAVLDGGLGAFIEKEIKIPDN